MKIQNLNKYWLILTILLIVDCIIGGSIAIWRNYYWDAVSHLQYMHWLGLIGIFSFLALLSCLVSGYSQYIANIASLALRTRLTRKALKLGNYSKIEGGAQRVQEDCQKYPSLMVDLIGGLLRSSLTIIIYLVIILYEIPGFYLIIPLLYVIIGTLIAGKISYKLIDLNYINQIFEAKFRQLLTKRNYKEVHNNNYVLFKNLKYLQYFQSFYNQVTVIIPHLILSGLFFGGKIGFGVFMQIASGLSEIINSMSFIINSFSDINKLLSCRKRLKELSII